ncbi:MAG: hypothetical protein KBC64_04080 [Simkaniaceae bacterium]|nr:hypothetical protein [Simkaniaceae bacterium]
MRAISFVLSLMILSYTIYWVSEKRPDVKSSISEALSSGSFHTLEARFSAEQIMENASSKLLKNETYDYLEPELQFQPYLLMEVKFSREETMTGEGIILWDLMDGEMVVETQDWNKSHGFADCLLARADKQEFKVINALARGGGFIDRNSLLHSLNIEDELLDSYLESCRRKKLIVPTGNGFRLHFEDPLLNIKPATIIDAPIVTKHFRYAKRLPRRFTPAEVMNLAEAAFGSDFAIRRTLTVYLPIYVITVQNPDGSLRTTYWNALNGKQLENSPYLD